MSATNKRPPGRKTRSASSIAVSRRRVPLTLWIATLDTTTVEAVICEWEGSHVCRVQIDPIGHAFGACISSGRGCGVA
jgi:hypothetical protein